MPSRRVPQSAITVEPGGYTTLTGTDGYYQLNLPTGSYTLTQTAPDVQEHRVGAPIPWICWSMASRDAQHRRQRW
ncbi:MAG: hypothetical protein R2817_08685 [Flavobacteriales bacterium]